VWEGSGTAHLEGAPAPMLTGRAAGGAARGVGDEVRAGETGAGEDSVEQLAMVVDWGRTRTRAADADEVWAEEQAYDEWMDTYTQNFKKPASLAATTILLDPLGKSRGLIEINRQFYRDVTSGDMVRLQGRQVPSRDAMEAAIKDTKRRLRAMRQANDTTHVALERRLADLSEKYEHHVARYAWEGVLHCVRGDVDLAHELASVANQNLGIACYEHLVHYFSAAGAAGSAGSGASDQAARTGANSAVGGDTAVGGDDALAVLQTGQHFLDISCDEEGGGHGDRVDGSEGVVRVRFEGLFKVVPFSLLDSLGVDGVGSSLVRAVVATAELRLVMAAWGGGYEGAGRRRRGGEEEEEEDAMEEEEEEGSGGGYGGAGEQCGGMRLLLDESTARFAIRRPVATVMVPEKQMSRLKEDKSERDNNGVDVEQTARVGAWVSDIFGNGGGNGWKSRGGGPGCKLGVIGGDTERETTAPEGSDPTASQGKRRYCWYIRTYLHRYIRMWASLAMDFFFYVSPSLCMGVD
jgi:hypothetical protein